MVMKKVVIAFKERTEPSKEYLAFQVFQFSRTGIEWEWELIKNCDYGENNVLRNITILCVLKHLKSKVPRYRLQLTCNKRNKQKNWLETDHYILII